MEDKQLSVEALLLPRWEVIALPLHDEFEVGDILSFVKPKEDVLQSLYKIKSDKQTYVTHQIWHLGELNKYPHLFNPIAWWKYRDVKFFPAFVRVVKNMCSFPKGTILQVDEWDTFPEEGNNWGNEGHPRAHIKGDEDKMITDQNGTVYFHPDNLEPATSEEYESQQSKSTNTLPLEKEK